MAMQGERARLAPRLIDSLYVEAMLLADEARAYFDVSGREDRLGLDPIVRVGFSCESLKVTTRLMHIVAWLLTRRAVEAGELSAALASGPERRLGESPSSDNALVERMPANAQVLIRSSQDLYDRIRRLDEGATAEPLPSPALGLISRIQRAF